MKNVGALRGARAFGVLLSLGVLLAACAAEHSSPLGGGPQPTLGTDLEPLRAAFNADTGKVRILMLVAPT